MLETLINIKKWKEAANVITIMFDNNNLNTKTITNTTTTTTLISHSIMFKVLNGLIETDISMALKLMIMIMNNRIIIDNNNDDNANYINFHKVNRLISQNRGNTTNIYTTTIIIYYHNYIPI